MRLELRTLTKNVSEQPCNTQQRIHEQVKGITSVSDEKKNPVIQLDFWPGTSVPFGLADQMLLDGDNEDNFFSSVNKISLFLSDHYGRVVGSREG